MLPKPEMISFNDFIKVHREIFTPFELWIVDGLSEFIASKFDIDKEQASIVVDADEDNPAAVSEGSIFARLNGRLYMPKETRLGEDLDASSEDWVDLIKKWFEGTDCEISVDGGSDDLIKFTALVPAIDMDVEQKETPVEEPKGVKEEPAKETPEKSEEKPAEKTSEETPEEAPEETSEESSEEAPEESTPLDEDMKEFEKALGL